MTRLRTVLIGILVAVVILAISCTREGKRSKEQLPEGAQTAQSTLGGDYEARPIQPGAWRALSLRVLNETVERHMASGECPDFVLKLCGITKIRGFVVDEGDTDREGDVILIGEVDDALPPLYLDDLVVALRNTWRKYARVERNTIYYSYPGCSIDPDPKTLSELQHLANEIFRSPSSSGSAEAIQRWKEVCSQPQKVRVIGIPRHSRFARVIVDADYYMKRITDGSVPLDIEGFISLVDMNLNKAKEDIIKGRPVSISPQLNRFWFYPGENQYAEDGSTAVIETCEVRLLTEQEFLTESGNVAGSGKADPLARDFADSFTGKYEEIARKKPIYAEQESLFRFVLLSKMMKYKQTLSQAGVDLDYLLNRYPVREESMPDTLPGIGNVKEFHHEADVPGGRSINHLWIPSCGGVDVRIDIRIPFNLSDLKDPAGLASKLKRASDPVSKYIHGSLSPATQKVLDVYDGTKIPSQELQKGIVNDLNKVLQDRSLYNVERFKNVRLSGRTLELIGTELNDEYLMIFNRNALQDAFPGEIKKMPVDMRRVNTQDLKTEILKTRPEPGTLFWDFPIPGKVRRPIFYFDVIAA